MAVDQGVGRTAAIALAASLWAAPAVRVAAEVPIRVEEPRGIARPAWPVTSGIPFGRGALRAVRGLALEDEKGRRIPIQTRVTCRWPDGSIKWVLPDFQVDLEPPETLALRLHVRPDAAGPAPRPPIVTGTEERIAVTGPLRTVLDPARFRLLDPAWLDPDGDGDFEPEERVTARDGTGAVVADPDGSGFGKGLAQNIVFTPKALSALPPDAEGDGEDVLPRGPEPAPVPAPYFPSRLHAFIWRNWELVPSERMARVLGTDREAVEAIGRSMGLPPKPAVSEARFRRSTTCVIRRNWHLLPYEQLLELLGWDAARLAYALREDDFLWIKLGRLKPRCAPLRYSPPDPAAQARARGIARVLDEVLGDDLAAPGEPRFAFLEDLARSRPAASRQVPPRKRPHLAPRFLYSYFAPYGDPLMDPDLDPYPEGYLQKLARLGVDGVWLHVVLRNLAPSTVFPAFGRGAEVRLRNLRALARRARRLGIGIYLYLNEPRGMPEPFFRRHPDVRGVREGDLCALCTSTEAVRRFLTESCAHVFRQVPELAGVFTITGSENLTHCYSHGRGKACPRCGKRDAADVVAEVNACIARGVRRGNPKAEVIAWDWGWPDDRAEATIAKLPPDVSLMSVSEWSLPIRRGGIATRVGEYCMSAVGPGPRAAKHWAAAKRRGLRTLAKVQCNVTWELSTVPFIPALENVAAHFRRLRRAGIDGVMLSWTLGGYPSPNLEVAGAYAEADGDADPGEVLRGIAARRYGEEAAETAVRAWRAMSRAFSAYPFHVALVYRSPVQLGPANPLYPEPTGYRATMTGFPYDDLDGWRGPYPPEVMASQFEEVAAGWAEGVGLYDEVLAKAPEARRPAAAFDRDIAEACGLAFRSVANQVRFVLARRALEAARDGGARDRALDRMEALARAEIDAARRLYVLARRRSVLGFEAANQYFYVPLDLAEKVVGCRAIIDRWIPAHRPARGRPRVPGGSGSRAGRPDRGT